MFVFHHLGVTQELTLPTVGTIDPPANTWPDGPLAVNPPAPLLIPEGIESEATGRTKSSGPRIPARPDFTQSSLPRAYVWVRQFDS